MTQNRSGITGYQRRRSTRLSVRVSDILARAAITVGGIGTILAVSTVALFLLWVVVPLFGGAEVQPRAGYATPFADTQPLWRLTSDEHQTQGLAALAGGRVVTFELATGEPLHRGHLLGDPADPGNEPPPGTPPITAASFSLDGDSVALGFADGTVRLGELGFGTRFPTREQVPDAVRALAPGQSAPMDGGIVQATPEGQYRLQTIGYRFGEPIATGSDQPVVLLDHVDRSNGSVFVAQTADGVIHANEVTSRRNLLTGKVTYRVVEATVPYERRAQGAARFIKLFGLGENLVLGYSDGLLVRYDIRNLREPSVAERVDAVPEPGAELSALGFVLGRNTLITGDTTGRVRGWFRIKPEAVGRTEEGLAVIERGSVPAAAAGRLRAPAADELPEPLRARAAELLVLTVADGSALVGAKTLRQHGAEVTAVSPATRSRMVAVGDASGQIELYYVTTQDRLASAELDPARPVRALAITPKENALLAADAAGITRFAMDPGHPAASLTGLFTRVWYEGYPAPAHVWQSSAGTDEFEIKLGLVPLIFGTLKATVFALVFAVPLALLAALYTSQFLSPGLKAKIKPTIEMMASLPSVVLGFLAGLVIAPVVENIVPAVLGAVLALPVVLLIGAYLWQLAPHALAMRWSWVKLPLMALLLPVGLAIGVVLGPAVEWALFAGDFKRWLDGQVGLGLGGWVVILLPVVAVAVAAGVARWMHPWFRRAGADWSRRRCAVFDLVKFLAALAVTLAGAFAVAGLLTAAGFDPREPIPVWGMDLAPIGTYVQRNALIVGFIMGFAVIPIIYTIADDAMSAVPEHLRSASLGAGATPWQTAVRVVIPTAMSGLFSACMIGLGRAVGETMIVLMALGNTPVLEANLFNGARTLSANIAVELPEAVRDSTHYRTLFLAALVLFVMTFLLNTVAEVVRLRFRKKAVEL